MALSQKDKGIKDRKGDDLASKIASKTEQRDRLISQQAADLQKVNDELDDLIVMKKAIDGLK